MFYSHESTALLLVLALTSVDQCDSLNLSQTWRSNRLVSLAAVFAYLFQN